MPWPRSGILGSGAVIGFPAGVGRLDEGVEPRHRQPAPLSSALVGRSGYESDRPLVGGQRAQRQPSELREATRAPCGGLVAGQPERVQDTSQATLTSPASIRWTTTPLVVFASPNVSIGSPYCPDTFTAVQCQPSKSCTPTLRFAGGRPCTVSAAMNPMWV